MERWNRLSRYVFISDFFYEKIQGGAESNDDVLISFLKNKGHSVQKIQSHLFEKHVKTADINNELFIVSNFCNLSTTSKNFLKSGANYIIYEHDHKYLQSRNPAKYKNFIAPKNQLQNVEFYVRANRVFCQSSFHLNILKKNLGDEVKAYNVSGNLWSKQQLKKITELSSVAKSESYAILESRVAHKNTELALEYCKKNSMAFYLIAPMSYENFLGQLAKNKGLVFFPKTPETLCRVAVEARMLNMGVITNKLLGAKYEPWFGERGVSLIEKMDNKIEEVYDELQKSF